ncbi:MAG: thiamine pyrophosphate-dependent dehydrogenase E1 component subunit alpha [Acidobacteriota bacterium]|nr:thiamine pyrophosphate-dependent dehydrogenase E1 component subunit alpha [Acidobacteriota bacterium]
MGINGPTTGKLLDMYTAMWRIRLFEEQAEYQSGQGKVLGALHTYIGQEAVGVGICAHLTDADYITSTHRGHGHCISKGADVRRMMAELFGRITGYCKGKGGSMHIADFSVGMLGANGIVAGGFGLATGAGLAAQMRESGQVAVCFFGDGAVNRGPFHENINLGAVWRLPVVYVCENNQYAQWTPQEEITLVTDVASMSSAYGIPGAQVNGMDVLSVYEVAGEAVDRARRGEGPTLLECKTYRFHGHNFGDPQQYRTKEEIADWSRRHDPIQGLGDHLQREGVLTAEEAESIRRSVEEEIAAAVRFADESPFPGPEELTRDVFSTPVA